MPPAQRGCCIRSLSGNARPPDLAATFLRWTCLRAAFHRGSQAETLGEILGGGTLAALAQAAGIAATLLTAAALLAATGTLVAQNPVSLLK